MCTLMPPMPQVMSLAIFSAPKRMPPRHFCIWGPWPLLPLTLPPMSGDEGARLLCRLRGGTDY